MGSLGSSRLGFLADVFRELSFLKVRQGDYTPVFGCGGGCKIYFPRFPGDGVHFGAKGQFRSLGFGFELEVEDVKVSGLPLLTFRYSPGTVMGHYTTSRFRVVCWNHRVILEQVWV